MGFDSVNDLLCNDEVQKTVSEFVNNDMPSAQAVLIAWIDEDKGENWMNSGGLSVAEFNLLVDYVKRDLINGTQVEE